jgi:hypothetical protein
MKHHKWPIEYVIHGNKPVLVIMRREGQKETDICHFCGSWHIHGTAPGHRIVHCADYPKKHRELRRDQLSAVTDDGVFLFAKDGYVIVNY